ncbi:SCAN domain-containing protein 3, partial [Stegodyphus mimosarum]
MVGAGTLTGRHSGVISQLKEVAPETKFSLCSIHLEALVGKTVPENYFESSMKIVNLIKS